ncbi:MAG: tryptophan synthase subunit alpha [Pseudomonadota bacterium]|nr:tryptophan synthase subunit alpha [Pseudomonadota bacterium]
MSRIKETFARLRKEGRTGLVTFVTGGDPDVARSREILLGLSEAGADIVELGMPFSDPMADGPSIQASSCRALASGIKLADILDLAADFRKHNPKTPLVLMGYVNPIWNMGFEDFTDRAAKAGVDGLIVVDLPPEEDVELRTKAAKAGIALIRLATPTSDDERMKTIALNASGFLYYVSITGVTGTRAAATREAVAAGVARIRKASDLPITVGFGIREPEQAAALSGVADAIVVGSTLVDIVCEAPGSPALVHAKVRALADALKGTHHELDQ